MDYARFCGFCSAYSTMMTTTMITDYTDPTASTVSDEACGSRLLNVIVHSTRTYGAWINNTHKIMNTVRWGQGHGWWRSIALGWLCVCFVVLYSESLLALVCVCVGLCVLLVSSIFVAVHGYHSIKLNSLGKCANVCIWYGR